VHHLSKLRAEISLHLLEPREVHGLGQQGDDIRVKGLPVTIVANRMSDRVRCQLVARLGQQVRYGRLNRDVRVLQVYRGM
jgi:hypothetical protein